MKTQDEFWRNVRKTDGCWEWLGGRLHWGYGSVKWNGRTTRAHRLAWTFVNGPIQPGMNLLHKCDNPPCVRPDHLMLGTLRDNTQDSIVKGRRPHQKDALAFARSCAKYPVTKVMVQAIRMVAKRAPAGTMAAFAKQFELPLGVVERIRKGHNWHSLTGDLTDAAQ